MSSMTSHVTGSEGQEAKEQLHGYWVLTGKRGTGCTCLHHGQNFSSQLPSPSPSLHSDASYAALKQQKDTHTKPEKRQSCSLRLARGNYTDETSLTHETASSQQPPGQLLGPSQPLSRSLKKSLATHLDEAPLQQHCPPLPCQAPGLPAPGTIYEQHFKNR